MAKEIDMGLDDLEFDSFDPKKRKAATTFKTNAAKIMKGVGSGSVRQATDMARLVIPGGAAFYREIQSTINETHDPVSVFQKELKGVVRELKHLGRVTLPGMQKYMPAKMYRRLENLTADKQSFRSYNEALEKENALQESLDKTMSIQHAVLETGIASQLEQSTLNKTQIGVLTGIQKQHIFANKFRAGVQRSYMRKNLELQHRQLSTATETRDLIKANMAMAEKAFERIVHNTALPDLIKTTSMESVKGKIKGLVISKGISSLGSMLTSMIKSGLYNANGVAGNLSSMLGMMADNKEMSTEMGMPSAGALGLAGNIAGGSMTKAMMRHLPKSIQRRLTSASNKSFDTLQAFSHGGVGAQQYLLKRGKYRGMSRMLAASMEGGTTVKFRNKALSNPDAPAQITNRFIHTVTDIIPSYMSAMERHLNNLTNGKGQEAKVYDIVKGSLNTASGAKTSMDEHLFGSKAERSDSLGRAVGATMAVLKNKNRLLSGKKIEKVMTRIISNAMAFNIPLHSYILEDVINARSDKDITDPILLKLSAGVSNRQEALFALYSAITDERGRERMDVTRRINRSIYDGMMSSDKLKSLGIIGSGQYGELYANARSKDGTFKRAYISDIYNKTDGLEYVQNYMTGYNSIAGGNEFGNTYKKDKAIRTTKSALARKRKALLKKSVRMPMIGKALRGIEGSTVQLNKKVVSDYRDSKLKLPEWLKPKGERSAKEIHRLQKYMVKLGENSTYDEISHLITETKNVELERQLSIQKLDEVGKRKTFKVLDSSKKYLARMADVLEIQMYHQHSLRSVFKTVTAAIHNIPYNITKAYTSNAMKGFGYILKPLFSPLTKFFSSKKEKVEDTRHRDTVVHYQRVEKLLTTIADNTANPIKKPPRVGSWQAKDASDADFDSQLHQYYDPSRKKKLTTGEKIKKGFQYAAAASMVALFAPMFKKIYDALPSAAKIRAWITNSNNVTDTAEDPTTKEGKAQLDSARASLVFSSRLSGEDKQKYEKLKVNS